MGTSDHPLHNLDAEALDRLLEEHQMLLEAIQNSPVHFAIYDHRDRLVAWNKPYEANYPSAFEHHRDKANAREMTYSDLLRIELQHDLRPDDLEAEIERRVALQAKADGKPVVRKYRDHTLKVYKYRVPSGAIAGIAVDISDLIERERELATARRAAEQSEASKGRFLANMSHEIRTPMNGIMGLASLLEETRLDDEQRELVRTITSSADALLSTINEVLDFSKIDAGKLEIIEAPFDLRALTSEVVDLLRPVAKRKGLCLRYLYPPSDHEWFDGDALRIRQCLLNLVGNAIKFTEEGAVTLAIDVAGSQDIHISVQDTGVGIALGDIDAIFSAFEQVDSRAVRRFDGTGLGLAITSRLVELMRGRIGVKSELGHGSTFNVTLPLDAVSQEEIGLKTKGQDPAPAQSLESMRVLVAEDNSTNRLVVKKMIGPLVAELVFAVDGAEAVWLWREKRPDVILMDISMPVMSGFDALKAIREAEGSTTDRTPIIALTANAMAEDRERCLSAGMDGFLTKPVRKQHLLSALSEIPTSR